MKNACVLLFVALAIAATVRSPLAIEKLQHPETKPTDYMIVITGGELLEGAFPDQHTWFLTRTLRPLGCRCLGSMSVGDNRDDLIQAIQFALQKAPLVIVTGGLGPTPNDITRETIAEFANIKLREHPDAIAELEKRFQLPKDKLRPNLRRQTLIPTRGDYLKNSIGTAVGLAFDLGESVIVALPGPPKELQPMTKTELVPYLNRRFGVRPLGCSVTLRFVALGQSFIDQTIQDNVRLDPDVIVSSYFDGSRVDFTFALPGNSAKDKQRLNKLKEQIRKHLGDYIYSDDDTSLEETVVKMLQAQGGSVTFAEVGSRSSLAAALSSVETLDGALAGAYSAPSEASLARVLLIPNEQWAENKSGPERVKKLASAAAGLSNSAWAIAVGQVQSQSPDNGFVWVSFKSPNGECEIQRLNIRSNGRAACANLAVQILDQFRRQLKKG